MSDTEKTCFVISPIGSEGTEVRRRADCLLQYIVEPAFKSLDFTKIERIDKTDEAEQITPSIIIRLFNAD